MTVDTRPWEINGAEGPTVRREPTLADRKAQAQQDAERDVSHHIADAASIVIRDGRIVGETAIALQTTALQHGAALMQRQARATDEQFIRKAEAEGVDGTAIGELERQLAERQEQRHEVATERQRSVDVLTGAVPDPWGRVLTGDVPEAKGIVALKWHEWLLVGAIGLIEAVPGFETARMLLDSSNPVIATALSLLVAVALFGMPLVIGLTIRGPKSPLEDKTRAQRWRRIGTVALLTTAWLAIILLLALARRDDVSAAIDVGAPTFDLMTAFLTAVFLATGLIIATIHARSNPHQESVARYNRTLAGIDADIEKLHTRIARSEALVDMHRIQLQATQDAFRNHIDEVLPAQNEEVQEMYRREFIRLSEDAHVTDAAMLPHLPRDPAVGPVPEPTPERGTFAGTEG